MLGIIYMSQKTTLYIHNYTIIIVKNSSIYCMTISISRILFLLGLGARPVDFMWSTIYCCDGHKDFSASKRVFSLHVVKITILHEYDLLVSSNDLNIHLILFFWNNWIIFMTFQYIWLYLAAHEREEGYELCSKLGNQDSQSSVLSTTIYQLILMDDIFMYKKEKKA